MIDDFTRINSPRVEKILAMLDTIEKSAKSNRADAGPLLAPVRARMAGGPAYGEVRRAPPAMPAPGVSPVVSSGGGLPTKGLARNDADGLYGPLMDANGRLKHAVVGDLARLIDVRDLTLLTERLVSRIDQELFETKGAS